MKRTLLEWKKKGPQEWRASARRARDEPVAVRYLCADTTVEAPGQCFCRTAPRVC